MRIAPLGLLSALLPAALWAQAPAAAAPVPGPAAPVFRGFSPGMTYRQFTEHARTLAGREPLVCNTSRRTAQLMECGIVIPDSADGGTLYVAAYVLEGRVATLSFRDSGGPDIVARLQRELRERFGRPRRTGYGTWEWTFERRVARLNWRGRGESRTVYLALEDRDVLDGISRYVPRPR